MMMMPLLISVRIWFYDRIRIENQVNPMLEY